MMDLELSKLASALSHGSAADVSTMCGILTEGAVDLVLDREFQQAEAAYRHIQRLMDGFVAQRGPAIEDTDGYLVGRVAGLGLVFGTIAARLPASFEELARHEMLKRKYRTLLTALMEGERTTTDLAVATGEEASTVSRKLTSLRHLGLVHSTGSGRLVHSRLTPVASSIFRQILDHEAASRDPSQEEESNVIQFPKEVIDRFNAAPVLRRRIA